VKLSAMAAIEDQGLLTSVGGLPPAHVIQAAWEVACQLDAHGAPVQATRHTYTRYSTGGIFPPQDLQRGERLLVDAGLLRQEGGMLYPTPALQTLAAVEQEIGYEILLGHCILRSPPDWMLEEPVVAPDDAREVLQDLVTDAERREAFLIAFGRRFDSSPFEALGELGEECVVAAARQGLVELGRDDLAKGVRRVSLLSDQLGYDVVAPCPSGNTRRLEVKVAGRRVDGLARFFLSRNEAEVGLRDSGWALVYCEQVGEGDVQIVGWCRGRTLEPYLPADAQGGRWRVAAITLPLTTLVVGIPPTL